MALSLIPVFPTLFIAMLTHPFLIFFPSKRPHKHPLIFLCCMVSYIHTLSCHVYASSVVCWEFRFCSAPLLFFFCVYLLISHYIFLKLSLDRRLPPFHTVHFLNDSMQKVSSKAELWELSTQVLQIQLVSKPCANRLASSSKCYSVSDFVLLHLCCFLYLGLFSKECFLLNFQVLYCRKCSWYIDPCFFTMLALVHQ